MSGVQKAGRIDAIPRDEAVAEQTRPVRLVISVSHPIQHFAPFYRAIAADPDIDLHVLFGAPIGIEPYFDAEMNAEIAWKMDMLGGYAHEFLSANASTQPGFMSMNSPALGKRLAALKPDVVLVYGYAQLNALRTIVWCRLNKVPAILISDSEQRRGRAWWKRAAKKVTVPRVLATCSAFLAVGDENEAYYRNYGVPEGRIFRSPFTIDEAVYRHARANRGLLSTQLRDELGIPAADKIALFVGKLSSRKRPDDLLEAVAEINRRRPEAKIHALFAGNGELIETLKAHARKASIAAHFPGFVNLDRLPGLYAASDVLVHPSSADPHPLVCSEAACIGLPMILSDRVGAAGPTDIARLGQNAQIYECGNIAALANALESIACDPDRLTEMSRHSTRIFDSLDTRASLSGLKSAISYVTRAR